MYSYPIPSIQTALITGASGGLGEEFAMLCAADGMNVVLIARNEEKLLSLAAALEETYGIRATVLPKDLSHPAAAQEIADALKKASITVDVLINNAGFGGYGLFQETDLMHEVQMIDVNVTTLTELTKLLLPGMLKHGRGRILNVASTAAFQPGPLMAVYYATKAYVLSFSHAIANELSGTGVTVTCLCPGPTRTGFEKGAHMGNSRLFRDAMRVMDAKTVAAKGYRGMIAGKRVVIPGFQNKLGSLLVRLIPSRVAASIARMAQEGNG